MMNNQTETSPKAPTHTVYIVKLKEGAAKPDWIKVGAAWEHGDKDGLNLSLHLLGQNISVTIRKNKPKTD